MAYVGVSEIVTKFLLSSYRLQPTRHDMQAVVASAEAACTHPPDDPDADFIPLISGSSAELYIKPMLSCVDDIDIMLHCSTELAIPAGYPAPTWLPAGFHSRVEVWEIIDSQYPGYVYLKLRYILTESNDDGRYNAMLDDRQGYVMYLRPASVKIQGPAVTKPGNSLQSAVDVVQCVRCLSWPPQAADWLTRHRDYGWPDSATVDCVVSNGGDVVQVAHRLCRQDEWESKVQWRLSFSRAEVVLLNSWTLVQQIVYHMLRVFTKISGLRDITDITGTMVYCTLRMFVKRAGLADITGSSGTKILSNYQIKTLMLWACEEKPRCWWTSDTNVVRICVELLHTLAGWLTAAHCPHYFINNCNLMDTVMNADIIVEQLKSVTESWLSMWFVNNYILKCAQLCPDNVSRLFYDISTSVKLQTAASAAVAWRRNTALVDLWHVYGGAECQIAALATEWYPGTRQLTDLYAYYNMQCSNNVTAIGLLHSALKLSKQGLNDKSMDNLSILCGQFIGRRRYSSQPACVLLVSEAVKFMKVVANNSRSTVQLIEIEVSKAHLYRALRCKDSDNDSIYCLANVYLAVLYYTTGQYQTAIDHCILVTSLQGHSQCSSHVVQGELLPKIDNNIDNVLGLAVFYQYVRTAALNQQQQTQHVRVFNTELFAHYLLIRYLSATSCQRLSLDEVQWSYRRNIAYKRAVCTADLLLCKWIIISVKPSCHFRSLTYQRQRSPTPSPTDLNTSELVELLQQSAVEHLTAYRQFEARLFGSVSTIVTTDFEAMYAYKRSDYQLCLQLSTQNVHTLLCGRRWIGVYTFPEFIQLLDDEIVSLTALTLIVNHKCREGSSFNVGISQLTLSLYLMTQCQLKLCHSATQLTRTLDYIQVAQRRHRPYSTFNHLTLKLAKQRAMLFMRRLARKHGHLL